MWVEHQAWGKKAPFKMLSVSWRRLLLSEGCFFGRLIHRGRMTLNICKHLPLTGLCYLMLHCVKKGTFRFLFLSLTNCSLFLPPPPRSDQLHGVPFSALYFNKWVSCFVRLTHSDCTNCLDTERRMSFWSVWFQSPTQASGSLSTCSMRMGTKWWTRGSSWW